MRNHISRILSNPFYTGKLLTTAGHYIQSLSHEALVDDELFNAVRRLLKEKQTSIHYTEKLDQPFRGLVRCAHCQRVYTPYTQKGIQYYNARCTKSCPNALKNIISPSSLRESRTCPLASISLMTRLHRWMRG